MIALRTKSQAGFTLVELLIVLAILAVAFSISLPKFTTSGGRAALTSHGFEVMSLLRSARADALGSNRARTILFELEKRKIRSEIANANLSIPEDVKLELTTARLRDPQSNQVQIVFYPDGSSSGGTVKISQNDQSSTITVDWLTGRIAMGKP